MISHYCILTYLQFNQYFFLKVPVRIVFYYLIILHNFFYLFVVFIRYFLRQAKYCIFYYSVLFLYFLLVPTIWNNRRGPGGEKSLFSYLHCTLYITYLARIWKKYTAMLLSRKKHLETKSHAFLQNKGIQNSVLPPGWRCFGVGWRQFLKLFLLLSNLFCLEQYSLSDIFMFLMHFHTVK